MGGVDEGRRDAMTTTRADRMRAAIEAYGEATAMVRYVDASSERIREEYRCVAVDMMAQALAILADASLDGDRLQVIADEAFGPFPVEPTEKLLTLVERGIFEQRKALAEAEKERDDALALAKLREEQRANLAWNYTRSEEAHLAKCRENDELHKRLTSACEERAALEKQREAALAKERADDARWLAVYGAAFNTWCPKVDVTDEAVERAIEEAETIANWEREARTKVEKR